MTARTVVDNDIRRLKVLVLDEFSHMRKLLHSMLDQPQGVETTYTAKNADEAFDDLARLEPDIVITDFDLDFVRRVRRAPDSPNRTVPILLLASCAEIPLIKQARDAGVNQILAKPVSAQALYVRLAAIVNNPAPFINNPGYVGPDRRHQNVGPPNGQPERRTGAG